MDREAAIALCREKWLKETTVRHLISVEGVMRALAAASGGRGPVGADRAVPRPRPGPHGRRRRGHAELAAGWLREAGVDERVVNGVLAHAYAEYRTDLMSGRWCMPTPWRGCWWRPRSFVPRRARDEGLVGEEEAEGEGVRARRQPRGVTASRSHRPAARRVPRGRDRGLQWWRRRSVCSGACSKRRGGRSSAPRRCCSGALVAFAVRIARTAARVHPGVRGRAS